MKLSESAIRGRLQRRGYSIHKDRHQPSTSTDFQGGYMITENWNGNVISGDRYDLSIEDVAGFLEDLEKKDCVRG